MKNDFDWSPWSACSKTCGIASFRTREKTCSLSLEDNEGRVCEGLDIQKVRCNVPLCPTQEVGRPNNIIQPGQGINKSKWL